MAFKGVLAEFVLVYLDDITIYSKHVADHFVHLEHIFKKCREYGVSLNPNKFVFATDQEKLLGHIVSKEGMAIIPERVEAIVSLPLPHHKKGLQILLGRINFVRKFIPNLAALVKPLTTMLKKDFPFKWTKEGKEGFDQIKQAIAQAPSLVNPNCEKDFILYTLGGDASISVILP